MLVTLWLTFVLAAVIGRLAWLALSIVAARRRSSVRCLLFGHLDKIDHFGGCVVECCRRCPWTGKWIDFTDPDDVRRGDMDNRDGE